ncbi:hypothetical protein CAEBREN_29321, partial [Caenorhabditis brenneri]
DLYCESPISLRSVNILLNPVHSVDNFDQVPRRNADR